MATSSEHITWPLTVGPDGYIVTADQDSDAEIESCMAVICLWPLGYRETDPDFGISEQVGDPDLDEIHDALSQYETRADESVTEDPEALADFLASITVGWTPSSEGGA